MSFLNKKYSVVKNAIAKDLLLFVYNYLLMKRQVAKTLFETRFISPFTTYFGTWKDPQILNTYSHYADIVAETLLLKVQPIIEKHIKSKLVPNYTYLRLYKNGDVLERHKDRNQCEISVTLNIGGDPWPIYLSPYENVGIPNGVTITEKSTAKGVRVNLKPGDMLIYSGCELEHWREEFKGEECVQIFLHYNKESKNIKAFDGRLHLGLPEQYKENG